MNKNQAIETAAKWWADRLKANRPHSNGDNSAASVFACLLADMGTEPVQDDKLELFKEELSSRINAYMDKFNDMYVTLMCDYGPGAMLCEAAEKAGINKGNFPFKTSISIIKRDNTYVVYAYDGYRAPREELRPCGENENNNPELLNQ